MHIYRFHLKIQLNDIEDNGWNDGNNRVKRQVMLANDLAEQKRDSVFEYYDDTSDDNNSDNDNSDYENNRAEIELCKNNSDTNQESTDNESDDELGHCFVCNRTGIAGSLCHCTEDTGAFFL